ncbi:unnamed protein product [Rhizoctonia solani]|uniref:Uncharacterized protein n=1 Tax=Rhizoctonia solani TaxID=456999 RepID=A0A8H2WFX0_9AGAM|nr:unnamed protein product [Rhizoctonia solani]
MEAKPGLGGDGEFPLDRNFDWVKYFQSPTDIFCDQDLTAIELVLHEKDQEEAPKKRAVSEPDSEDSESSSDEELESEVVVADPSLVSASESATVGSGTTSKQGNSQEGSHHRTRTWVFHVSEQPRRRRKPPPTREFLAMVAGPPR